MTGKTFFIDQSRCTACRGCQVACKQWKKLPATDTVNRGSYQNPPQVDGNTLKIVHFSEAVIDGTLRWLFFPEQCRHCVTPPCKLAADAFIPGAILQDPATGAILYTEKTRELDYETIRQACPYDIPRQEAGTGILTKCNMCIDRVQNGMEPACVKTCPSHVMFFGDREDMLALARKRLTEVRMTRPAAILADAEHVRVLYLCEFDPSNYYSHLSRAVPSVPGPISRRGLLGLKRFA